MLLATSIVCRNFTSPPSRKQHVPLVVLQFFFRWQKASGTPWLFVPRIAGWPDPIQIHSRHAVAAMKGWGGVRGNYPVLPVRQTKLRTNCVILRWCLSISQSIELEGTHRVQTHAVLLYPNPNLELWPFNPKTMSLLASPKVIPYTLGSFILSYVCDKQTTDGLENPTYKSTDIIDMGIKHSMCNPKLISRPIDCNLCL